MLRERFVDSDGEMTVVGFEAFYYEHFRSMLRLAFALTRDHGMAEDVTQEAFLAARQSWRRISGYDRPDLWVRKVISNRCASRIRRAVREANALARLRGRRQPLDPPPDPWPEVWDAVAALPRRQGQAVILVLVEDLSVGDAAEILGCGPETVRTHLRRARARLAVTLREDRQ